MLAFRDFVPQELARDGFFTEAVHEAFEQSVSRANEWIAESGVTVVNLETVVLPNIHDPDEEGPSDGGRRASGKVSSYWHQFVRVWYRIQ